MNLHLHLESFLFAVIIGRMKMMTLNFEETDEDYLNFTKRIEMTKEYLKKINIIQDYQTKKAAFEELMTRKLGLHEAIELKEKLNDLSCDFYVKEIKILDDNIRPCEIWCEKMRGFLGKYEKYVVDDELNIESSQRGEILRGISSVKEEMNKLILKDSDLENKIVVFDWLFQAKLFMRGEEKIDVKYWKDLLNKAGRNKKILESERYKEICREVKDYESLITQVKQIERQEKLLLEERKGLKDVETIESLLKRLMKSCILTWKEERYLEKILDQAGEGMIKYRSIREDGKKIPLKKFQSIVKSLKELPIKLPQEIEEQIMKEVRINELLNGKQKANEKLKFDIAKEIFNEYEGCIVDIPEAQTISIAYNEISEVLKKIENIREKLSYEALCELDRLVRNSPLDLGSERFIILKVKIWQAKVDLISFLKENVEVIPEKLIPLHEVSKCLNEGYAYLDDEMNCEFKASIHFLEDFIRDIEEFWAKISHSGDPRKERCPFTRFIDLKGKIGKLKIAGVERIIREQSNPLQKRQESYTLTETTATSMEVESEGDHSSQDEVLVKKVRTENGFFGIEQIVSKEASSEEEKVGLGVNEIGIEKILELAEKLRGEDLKNSQEVIKELVNKRSPHEKVETVCDSLKKLRENICLVEELFKQKFTKCSEKKAEILEPEEEDKEQPFQRQIQPNEELKIPPQESDPIKEMIRIDDKERDTESMTNQVVLEIANNQNCELPIKDENVPYKHLYNHPLYRRPKPRYPRGYYPPKLRYSPDNLAGNHSTESLENSDFHSINTFNQDSHSPPFLDSQQNQNQSDITDAEWESFLIDFFPARETDELEECDIQTKGNLNEPFVGDEREVELSNVAAEKAKNPFGKHDNTIKQIFRGKITQQTKEGGVSELLGSLYTYASSSHVFQFPKISIPELKFHQDFFHKFCINLNRLKNQEKSQFQKVLIGWVSVETQDPNPFAWKEKNEIGKCSDIPGVEIYLLPISSDYEPFERLKNDLNWVYDKNNSASVPEQHLLFAICLTTKSLHTNLKRSKLMTLKRITRQSKKQSFMKSKQQTDLQNDLTNRISGLENQEELLEQESEETFEISEISEDTKLVKVEEQQAEKMEIKIREKPHRQQRSPVLVEPESNKEKTVRGKNGEKRKRGRPFKQNPWVSMPKNFELKLLMKIEE